MVYADTIAAYLWLKPTAWSKGRQPPGAFMHLPNDLVDICNGCAFHICYYYYYYHYRKNGEVWLLDLLTDYAPVRTLRSSNTNLLTAPTDVKTATASRTFQAAAPKLWNSLPMFVKSSCSYDAFKLDSKVICLPKFLPSHLWVVIGVSISLLCSANFTWRLKYFYCIVL